MKVPFDTWFGNSVLITDSAVNNNVARACRVWIADAKTNTDKPWQDNMEPSNPWAYASQVRQVIRNLPILGAFASQIGRVIRHLPILGTYASQIG